MVILKSSAFLSALILSISMVSLNAHSSDSINREKYNEVKSRSMHTYYSDINLKDQSPSPLDVNAYPVDQVLCDPITGEKAPSLQNGIKAQLYIKDSAQLKRKHFQNLSEAFSKSKLSKQKMFFSSINVPTTFFKKGFMTGDNTFISDDQGYRLIEDFGISYEFILKLAPNQNEGEYELSLLSDDGSSLEVFVDNKWVQLINNDGNHATKMGCAKNTVKLSKSTALPVRILYYQGPRNYMANVLIWREAKAPEKLVQPKLKPGQKLADYMNELRAYYEKKAQQLSLCKYGGNNLFFSPARPEKVQPGFAHLQKQGWSVVAKENFFLPRSEQYNPCAEVKKKPVISNIYMQYVLSNGAVFSFNTDIPASAYYRLTNVATGEIINTQSDNVLRTNFYMGFFEALPQTAYDVQIVVVSADGGQTVSDPIRVNIP